MYRVPTLALALTTCLCSLPAQGPEISSEGKLIIDTSLDALRADPDAFKAVWVRFDVQFSSLGAVSNPFFTRFEPIDFANFYVWGGDQPIWRRDSYDDVFPTLFMSKRNPNLKELYTVKQYERLRVTGMVQNTFQALPWIEVTEFQRLPSEVDTPTLAHLYRAERHMQNREWRKAISELSLAPSADKPGFVRASVHKNMGVCHLRLGEADQARHHLQLAQNLESGDRELNQLAAAAVKDPRSELDQGVDKDSVPEVDLPLWTAFEDEQAETRPTTGTAKPQR